MKKRMIRLLCAAGVLAAMACGAWAVTSPDGLVSLSYLNNTFLPSAVEKGTTAAYHKLQQTYVHDIKEELVRRKNCKEASASL